MYVLCRAKRREVRALGEQVELFRETMKAKDDVVVQLTNKVRGVCGLVYYRSIPRKRPWALNPSKLN